MTQDPQKKTRRGAKPGQRRVKPWHDDEHIMARVALHSKLYYQGMQEHDARKVINDWLDKRDMPPISRECFYDDRKRVKELSRESMRKTVDESREHHLAELEMAKDKIVRAFEAAGATSLNRSAYMNAFIRAVEAIAKIDGTYMRDQAENAGAQTLRDLLMEFGKEDEDNGLH